MKVNKQINNLMGPIKGSNKMHTKAFVPLSLSLAEAVISNESN